MAKQSEATLLLKIKTMGADAIKAVEDNFDTLKTAGLAAFAAISAVVVKAVMDYREQEIATNALTQAMINNGVYSKALKDDYLAQAAAIQKVTLFGDEQVIGAQAAIQAQIGEGKVTKELTMAVADLAQAKKMDLVSAAELVAKTLGSSNNMLARQGVQFDNNTRGAERLTAVTEALNQKFGGQATAATSGYGAIKQLSNAVSDVLETFGEKLLPVLSLAARTMKEYAEETKNSSPAMDVFVSGMTVMAEAANNLVSKLRIVETYIIGNFFGAIEAGGQMLAGEFTLAMKTLEDRGKEMHEELARQSAEYEARQSAIANAASDTKKAILLKEEQDLMTSLENKKNMKQVMLEEESAKILADNQLVLDTQAAHNEMERAQKSGNDTTKLTAQAAVQEAILKSHATHTQKLAAQQELFRIHELQRDQAAALAKEAGTKEALSTIAGLQKSSNQALAIAGKAAALTQIAIDTPKAIASALANVPYPFNFAAAAGVGIAMGAQAAQVMGVPLAEGGIVKARPGGIQATIGEGGRDEAVIPLENGQIPGSQGGHTFNFYGPVMGDERQAQEHAVMIDRELLKLRRNGESVAFDRIT